MRSSRGYDVWVESSMTRVYPRTLPAVIPGRPAAHLTLAGGEYQSLQIVLRPRAGHGLRNVRVRLTPLSGQTGISPEHIEWHQVGYVRVENMDYRWIQPNVEVAKAAGAELPGWWPDPLLPVEEFGVAPEFAQPIWITIYAPPGTSPGKCSGAVTIEPENDRPVTVRVRATVYDFTLPPGAGEFRTAFGLLEDQLKRVYGRLDERMRLQWGDYVLKHRINPGSIYRTDTPVVSDLEHWLEGGMNAFNVIYNRQTRERESQTGLARDALDRIRPFLEELQKSKYAERLFNMAHYYGFDEVTVDRLGILREEFRIVREQFGLPTFTTSHVPQTPAALRKLNVDWLCPITNWLKPETVAHCRREGFKMWTYVSLEPDPPYANVRFDCPLIESRVLIWQMYQQQMDGFLYWAFNAWRSEGNDRPFDPVADGPFLKWNVTSKWISGKGVEQSWLHGDGRLLYPGKDGPIGCIRLANLRDGIQDWEYLRLLGEKTGRPADPINACEPVTTDWTHFTRDPAVVETQRGLIARRIEGK